MTPLQLKNNLKRFTIPVLQKEVSAIILRDNKIIDRKRDELKAGVSPDGSDIGTYRSPSYAVFKQSRNPFAGGKVDLILTGAYERAIKVLSLGNSKFTLRSSDSKRNDLIAKYGIENEGINNEIWNKLQKFDYMPQLVNKIRPKIER